jgi:rhodanese-related sulfurtransferase
MTRLSIDELLELARARLRRVEPADVAAAVHDGALLVDIRPAALRATDGDIPGAIVIERNVLEWRLDPRSAHRIPQVDEHKTVIIVCDEGYASSLAAATLQQLGLPGATDLVGGFQAWRRSGLSVSEPASSRVTPTEP